MEGDSGRGGVFKPKEIGFMNFNNNQLVVVFNFLKHFGLIILLCNSFLNEGFSQDSESKKTLDHDKGFEFTFYAGLSEEMSFNAIPGSYNRLSARYAFHGRRIGIGIGIGSGFQSFGIKESYKLEDALGFYTNAYTATLNLVPVTFDVLMSYTLRFGPRGNLTFEIGPQLNIITTGKLNINRGVFTIVDVEHSFPLEPSLNAGLVAGVSHRIPVAPWLWLSLKYSFQYIFGQPSIKEEQTSNYLTYHNKLPNTDEYYISGGVVNQQGIEVAFLNPPERIGGQHHFSIGLIWTLPSIEK